MRHRDELIMGGGATPFCLMHQVCVRPGRGRRHTRPLSHGACLGNETVGPHGWQRSKRSRPPRPARGRPRPTPSAAVSGGGTRSDASPSAAHSFGTSTDCDVNIIQIWSMSVILKERAESPTDQKLLQAQAFLSPVRMMRSHSDL